MQLTITDLIARVERMRELAGGNYRLAYGFAHSKRNTWHEIDRDDVAGECMLALVNAALHFDPARARFSTLAYTSMWRRMQSVGGQKRYQPLPVKEPRVSSFAIGIDPVETAIVNEALATLPAEFGADDIGVVSCFNCRCDLLGPLTAAAIAAGHPVATDLSLPAKIAGRVNGRPSCWRCMRKPQWAKRKGVPA